MFNSTNISPTREFPQPLIIAYGFCGPYVCTVRQTFRPHRQASLIRFSVLSTHLFTSREQWQRIAKCQYTGKICASFFSLFVYLCLPLCMSNSWAPNTTSHCAPPSSINEAYCWPTRWHTAVHFFCKRSSLPDEPRSWQKHTDTLLSTLFSTAVQINVRETFRKLNLVIVLASKPAVQRPPPPLFLGADSCQCFWEWMDFQQGWS